MAVTPDGGGYWLVERNGRVWNFGDAHFYGSLPYYAHFSGMALPPGPVVGIASTPTGRGYWITESTGKVFAFGDAQRFKELALRPDFPIVAISPLHGTPAVHHHHHK
jgi:hypothetical protein